MNEEETQRGADPRGGDRRKGDRRKQDRRRTDRRAPAPWWRRPAALVAYGVLGTLIVVIAVGQLGSAAENEDPARIADGTPAADELPPPPVAAAGDAEPALTSADYDRLMVEGDEARGRMIRVELFCEGVQAMPVRSVDEPDPRIEARTDDSGRISGAQCRWGRRGEDRREDFFLIIPSELAEDFASAPIVADGFVRRRHVIADVEWVGRSEELSLRTGGVLREVVGGGP